MALALDSPLFWEQVLSWPSLASETPPQDPSLLASDGVSKGKGEAGETLARLGPLDTAQVPRGSGEAGPPSQGVAGTG